MKLDRKFFIKSIISNRLLILICLVLILGSVFGTCVLKFLPENISENLFDFISKRTDNFSNLFINKFIFPFSILTGIYLSGFSIIGRFSAFAMIFINGMFFGFESALNYMYSGFDYVYFAAISYFTATFCFGFFIILMTENAVFDSIHIIKCINGKNDDKSLYKAKNRSIKFITFTAMMSIFSAISAYITRFQA